MANGFNSRSAANFGVPGLQTAHDSLSTSGDIVIPSVGVEDVDTALFNAFDKEIPFQVSTGAKDRSEFKRVPIVFAAAEKWALAKRRKAIRDRNGSLVLPLITVVRTSIRQSPTDDIAGRGTNQQTGEVHVKRRLDASDRSYQGLFNRLMLRHQRNVAVNPINADVGQLTTFRQVGDLAGDPTIVAGGTLVPDRTKNVFETLVLPTPQFYTATYEITFWAQYTVQMTQMLETLVGSFLPQGNAWKLETPKGYWFIATVEDGTYTANNNVDDMSSDERMLKYTFSVTVPAYILVGKVPGAPIPIKRYVSAPDITFDVTMYAESIASDGADPFIGSDDPTLPLSEQASRRRDQRDVGGTRLYPNVAAESPNDPALRSRPRGTVSPQYRVEPQLNGFGGTTSGYVRVVSSNASVGETVLVPAQNR